MNVHIRVDPVWNWRQQQAQLPDQASTFDRTIELIGMRGGITFTFSDPPVGGSEIDLPVPLAMATAVRYRAKYWPRFYPSTGIKGARFKLMTFVRLPPDIFYIFVFFEGHLRSDRAEVRKPVVGLPGDRTVVDLYKARVNRNVVG